MKVTDTIRRAGRNLRQAKGRTILTALAISVGAFTITAALAAGAGGRAYVDGIVSTTGDTESLQVFPKYEAQGTEFGASSDAPAEYSDTPEKSAPTGGTITVLTNADVEKIRHIDGIEAVTPMFNISAQYMQGPNGKKYETSLDVKVDKTALELAAGSLTNNQPDVGKVSIAESYVESLGFKDAADAIGKRITLHIPQLGNEEANASGKDVTFTIQAVDKQGTNTLMYFPNVRLSAADAEEIYRYQVPAGAGDSYYGLVAQVAAGKNVRETQDAVKAAGYDVYSLQDMREAMFTAVNVAMTGLAGFGALAILASIFGIINTMYISVLERTQQIGLMKALGMRSRDVGRLFRFEAAWIGFLGGAIGSGLAIIMGLIANPIINDVLKLEGKPLLIFEPLSVILIVAALMLVAIVSGYFPSRKAAKLDPIEALRTE